MSTSHHTTSGHLTQDNTKKTAVLGPLRLDRTTLAEAMRLIEAAVVDQTSPLHIVTANAQFLGQAHRDQPFAHVVDRAGLVVPDGVPLIWLCRLRGVSGVTRITGHDLLYASVALAAAKGYSVGFLGTAPGVAEAAVQRLTDQYPTLRVAGIFRGSFAEDGTGNGSDEEGMVQAIKMAQPDLLFVALGCPKQEMWIAHHQREIGTPVAVGIGGVLDVLAGRFRRAPQWMQRVGLEWAYRLVQDPKRLGKRYLLQDLPTLAYYTLATMRERTNGNRTAM